jgi:hypothetical protein
MGDQTTNTDGASNSNTAGAAGNNAQGANQSGGATDASNQSQAGNTNNTANNTQQNQNGGDGGAGADNNVTDPQLKAALELLQNKGYKALTEKQFNGHMAQARRSGESDAEGKARQAQQQAEEAARIANGEAQKVAEERQARITTLEAEARTNVERLERLSKHVNAQIEASIAQVPPVLKEFDPGPDNLDARMEWYEKLLKHPEIISGQGGGAGYRQGTGLLPQPQGSAGTNPVASHISRRYGNQQQNSGQGNGR